MKGSDTNVFYQIANFINENPFVRESARPGLCRMWSGQSLQFLRGGDSAFGEYEVEAREVTLPDGVSHTFLRISIDGKGYIMDGTGVDGFPAYFGLEEHAPKHLLDSQPDVMINTQEQTFLSREREI